MLLYLLISLLPVLLGSDLWWVGAGPLPPVNSQDFDCSHLDHSQELICQCVRNDMTIDNLSDLTEDFLGKPIQAIKIHNCLSLSINITTSNIAKPFYQLRISDISYVTVRNIDLGPGDSLDIVFRNIGEHLNILGNIGCTGCDDLPSNKSSDIRVAGATPTLSIQIIETINTNFQQVFQSSINLRLKTRHAKHISISKSTFQSIPKNSIEIFYTNSLEISNSQFLRAANSSFGLNFVASVSVRHSLGLRNDSFNLMSLGTALTFTCTLPTMDMDIIYYLVQWDEEACGPVNEGGGGDAGAQQMVGEGGATGPVVFTVVCVLLLATVIGTLVVLNKTGKLDRYL